MGGLGQPVLNTFYQSSHGLISNNKGGLLIQAIFDDIPFPSSNYSKSIELRLAAVGTTGEVNTVSSPRILVEENTRAEILIGSEIPYSSSASSATGIIQNSFQFMETGTKMIIVPRIVDTKKDKIKLKLSIESSTATLLNFSDDGSLKAPQKNLTRTKLETVCRSGQTLIIAGFINYTQIDETVGIPLLKDIPFIKFLFSNTVQRLERREVAILITPRIIDQRGTPIKRIYKQLYEQSEN